MKADAFVDWDWLASETVLKLAPALPDAVEVEVLRLEELDARAPLHGGELDADGVQGVPDARQPQRLVRVDGGDVRVVALEHEAAGLVDDPHRVHAGGRAHRAAERGRTTGRPRDRAPGAARSGARRRRE